MELVTQLSQIVVVGEGMVELSGAGNQVRLGFGGDTLNTAIHLTRFGLPTAYFTALGSDRFSTQLRSDWAKEGLDTSLILTDPDRHPGLYAVHVDPHGERSFTYWRSDSAARRMFELEESAAILQRAEEAALVYFSSISLAILPPHGRESLIGLARRVRDRGVKVAFDANYRPSLWRDQGEAIRWRDAAIALSDIGLPTLQDECELSGHRSAEEVAAHWQALGAEEVVVKMGSAGAFIDGATISPPSILTPVDTAGAGDAFNAAYLASRQNGANARDAASFGHLLAGWTIMRPGAIPAADDDAPYDRLGLD